MQCAGHCGSVAHSPACARPQDYLATMVVATVLCCRCHCCSRCNLCSCAAASTLVYPRPQHPCQAAQPTLLPTPAHKSRLRAHHGVNPGTPPSGGGAQVSHTFLDSLVCYPQEVDSPTVSEHTPVAVDQASDDGKDLSEDDGRRLVELTNL